MKLKDWLKTIITPLVATDKDADLFLSASDLKEVEVSDDMQKAFTKTYLTRDSALSDAELAAKFSKDAKGLVFGSVDQKLKKHILPLLEEEDQKLILAESNTLTRIEMLEKSLAGLSKNDDIKKISAKAREKEQELHDKIIALEGTIKKKDETATQQIGAVKMDYALRTKVFGVDLAPEFGTDTHKTFLADSIISKIKKNYIPQFDEKDESIIHLRRDVEGVVKDVFEDNKKVTLDDVLKKEYEPYTKKSSAGQEHTPPKKQEVQLPNDRPLTVQDRRRAAAAASA